MNNVSYAIKQNGFRLSVLKEGKIDYSLKFESQISKINKTGQELAVWLKDGTTKIFTNDGLPSYEYKTSTKLSKEEKKRRKQQFLSKSENERR